jgi:hypothetical protein
MTVMDDPVLGVECPGCEHRTVVYNGNYWCGECGWRHTPPGSPSHDPEEAGRLLAGLRRYRERKSRV